MITKFKLFENYETGLFGIYKDGKYMSFHLDISQDEKVINLIYDESIYSELSIDIPEAEELNKGEFFLNPKVEKKIIEELVKQNFIEKSNKNAIAGDKKTSSYRLI